ncbi:MAG: cell surface protein SprA, partial [Ignavibacteria bacterium]|nr:cell surface protein SprA [Ignavibacteria bacterium]
MKNIKILLLIAFLSATIWLAFGFQVFYKEVQSPINSFLIDYAKLNENKNLSQSIGLTQNTPTFNEECRIQLSLPDTTEEKKGKEIEEEKKFFEKEKLSDTSKAFLESDSLLAVDTIKIDSMMLDSTARLQQFKPVRKDHYQIPLFVKRTHPLLLKQSTEIVRTVKLDSLGRYVEIHETINGKDIKLPIRIALDDYIKLKLNFNNRKIWEELATKYEAKLGKKEFADIISNITNIDIPIPATPVLSIFGPPKINLRINGAVDIRGAWRNETTEGITASRLGNTKNEPDFKQDVQINISGTIGDKLNITADWNTQNTFEYENQLKIKYTGYQDEIVQSVEAGNVSLQTSPLVGGGEALFGVKARMQFGPLMLTALASQKRGQVKEKSLSGGSEAQNFSIRAWQFSKNHFFLDQVYADTSANLNIFNKYYANATPIILPDFQVNDIEVWKTYTGIPDPKERQVVAYINLNPRLKDEKYPESLRDTTQEDGKIVVGRFIKLEPADYVLHKETGYISFRTQIQESDAIAVAYRVGTSGNERFYGEFFTEAPTDKNKKIILKLIKPANLQPQFKEAWNLQLKNIYPLGVRNVKEEGFELDIKYAVEG